MISPASSLGDFAEAYLRRRYSILFYTLLFTMVATPVLDTLKLSGALLNLLVAACLLAAIIPFARRHTWPEVLPSPTVCRPTDLVCRLG